MAQVEMCSESLSESFIDLFGFRQIHLGCQPRFPSTVLAFTHDTVGADLALTYLRGHFRAGTPEIWSPGVKIKDREDSVC